jgi:hypothetical protein
MTTRPPRNITIPPAPGDGYSCPCPRCGYPETSDAGPYVHEPVYDDKLGGPPDPRIHLMWCGRCGGPFDAGPADLECQVCGNCHTNDVCGSDGCICETTGQP